MRRAKPAGSALTRLRGTLPWRYPSSASSIRRLCCCALLRPKDTHAEPLDEDGEDEPEDEPAQHLDDPEERTRDDAGLGGMLGRGRCGLSGQRLVPRPPGFGGMAPGDLLDGRLQRPAASRDPRDLRAGAAGACRAGRLRGARRPDPWGG